MLSYIIKNGSWVFLGNIALSLLAFATTVVLTNILPKDVFGSYRFVLSIVPILAICTLPDMGVAITKAAAGEQNFNLTAIVKTKIRYGLIASFISLILGTYYLTQSETTVGTLFILASLLLPFFDVFLIYINPLYGQKNFKVATRYQIISRVFSTLVILGVALLTKNIIAIFVTFFIAQILPQLFFFTKVKKNITTSINEATKQIILYGKKLTVIGGLATIAANIDKILIWHYFGNEALATYTVALLLILEGNRLIDALSITLLPFLASKDGGKRLKETLSALPIIIGLLSVIAAITYFIIPVLFSWFFPTYTNIVFLAQISCVLIIILPINTILYRQLIVKEAVTKMVLIQIIKVLAFTTTFFTTMSFSYIYAGLYGLIVSEITMLIFLSIETSNHLKKTVTGEDVASRVIADSRFSRKTIVGKIKKWLPWLSNPINLLRYYTFQSKCNLYPDSAFIYSDGPWVDRKVTVDQRAIEGYLEKIVDSDKKILHVGIGSSNIAKTFSKKGWVLEGITVVQGEKEYAETLQLPNYSTHIVNKNKISEQHFLTGNYDFIIDNDIAAYACCKTHFEEMLQYYLNNLRENGEILFGVISKGYFDSGFPLPSFYINELSKRFVITIEEINGVMKVTKDA